MPYDDADARRRLRPRRPRPPHLASPTAATSGAATACPPKACPWLPSTRAAHRRRDRAARAVFVDARRPRDQAHGRRADRPPASSPRSSGRCARWTRHSTSRSRRTASSSTSSRSRCAMPASTASPSRATRCCATASPSSRGATRSTPCCAGSTPRATPGFVDDQGQLRRHRRNQRRRGPRLRAPRARDGLRRPLHRVHAAGRRAGDGTRRSVAPSDGPARARSTGRTRSSRTTSTARRRATPSPTARPGSVGFISSVTAPFCASCDRVRITADGQLRSCLFATRRDRPARRRCATARPTPSS